MNDIGRQIGNYRVIAEVGSGGFARVYRGEHIFLTERAVAIKLLHTHLSSLEEYDRFLQEAYMLEKLKHDNILLIYDVGIDQGFPYLVAEYAPNGSLRDRIKRYAPNPLPLDEAVRILSEVGQALEFAHQRNVIHRDIKPENILFNRKDQALLADFGIATALTSASFQNVKITGTPSYMAPEQFQGNVSKESDQYALGCIGYELVTGRRAFSADNVFATGFKHLNETPPAPAELNADVPLYIEQAILKAMARERSNRHSDLRAFIKALQEPTISQVSTPAIPANVPQRGKRGMRRRWLILSIAAIITAAVIIGSLLLVAFPGTSRGSDSIILGTQAPATGSQVPSLTSTAKLTGTPGLKHSKTPASTLPGTPPRSTSTPTLTSSPRTSHLLTPTANATATPTPKTSETLTVDFTNTNGTQTNFAYSGAVTLTISGIGQASANQWSDAFYRYTDPTGTPIATPGHPNCWVLWINDRAAEYSGQLPAYNGTTHTYTFNMNAPGGSINFKVCDSVYSDNTGSYTITVTQN